MRRIDVLGIGLGVFVAGGIAYFVLQRVGLDSTTAGIWSQALLVCGLVGWLLTYLFRAATQTMTYNQQLQDYEDAVLQKRLDEMTPEQLAQLQAEIEQEQQLAADGQSLMGKARSETIVSGMPQAIDNRSPTSNQP